jgi:hypothetical protein
MTLVSGYIHFLSRVVSSFSNRVIPARILSFYISSAGWSNLKCFLQLKFFWPKHDNPYFQEHIKEGSFSLFVTFKIELVRYLR